MRSKVKYTLVILVQEEEKTKAKIVQKLHDNLGPAEAERPTCYLFAGGPGVLQQQPVSRVPGAELHPLCRQYDSFSQMLLLTQPVFCHS